MFIWFSGRRQAKLAQKEEDTKVRSKKRNKCKDFLDKVVIIRQALHTGSSYFSVHSSCCSVQAALEVC